MLGRIGVIFQAEVPAADELAAAVGLLHSIAAAALQKGPASPDTAAALHAACRQVAALRPKEVWWS